ncbi:MAG: NUDIX hydrolase [Spirochaetaceae bacterium]|jgi:8-oxo-dGTP pyrophosphatase MutT (NUDIX family)|nr:NUDIX hydrolase [Spirochaetaceae bacterium]
MDDDQLKWREIGREAAFKTKIFTVTNRTCVSPQGGNETFTVIETNDWVVVVPELEDGKAFYMVRQWRHGAGEMSLEFPGGVIETGETALDGAERELREETGCVAGKMTKLGVMSPNPAIMANRVHFFLAEDLRVDGDLRPDKDEFITAERVDAGEVTRGAGAPPYIHSLMATALCLYNRLKQRTA